MTANPNSVPIFGTTAEILALVPNNFGVGTIMVSSDQRRAWLVRFDAGTGANYLEPIVVADGQPFTTPTNLTVYVSTAGNDANDGLTPATAVATLNQALVIVGTTGYTLTCLISVGAGVFPMPVTAGTPVGIDATNIIIPMPKGANARTALPPIIRGAMTTLAADTVFAVTAGVAPTFTTIQLTVGGYAVNQFANTWLEPTSGTRVGSKILIESNTANTLTLAGTYSAGILPIAGDAVAMRDVATTFRWTSGTAVTQNVVLWGDAAWFDAIEFQTDVTGAGSSFTSQLGALTLTRCKFTGNVAFGWSVSLGRPGGIIAMGGVRTAFADNTSLIPTSQVGGCVLKPKTGTGSLLSAAGGGLVTLTGSVCDSYAIQISGGLFNSTNSSLPSTSIKSTRRGTVVQLTFSRMSGSGGDSIVLAGVTYSAALLVAIGGMATTSGSDISGSGAGVDGVCAVDDGYVEISGVLTSAVAPNGGFGVNCRKRSRVQVDLPNTSATITGGAGAVQVGANAVSTWALILGNVAADINDLAAVPGPTEICYVSK